MAIQTPDKHHVAFLAPTVAVPVAAAGTLHPQPAAAQGAQADPASGPDAQPRSWDSNLSTRHKAHWLVIARVRGHDIDQRLARTRVDANIAAEDLRRQYPGAVIVMRCSRPGPARRPTRRRLRLGHQNVTERKQPQQNAATPICGAST